MLMPLSVFAFGIVGAFTTTSMQSADKAVAPISGWAKNAQGVACRLEVQCDNQGQQMCRVSYGTIPGEIAYLRPTPTSPCTTHLFRPGS